MARIRTIKPEFFTSLTIADLSLSARLTFIGLWTYVDDEGRAIDDPRLIKAAVWPLDNKHTLARVEADLALLHEFALIERYEGNGARVLQVRSWKEHQRINRPSVSKHPPFKDDAVTTHGALTEDSSPEGKGKEQGKEQHHYAERPENPEQNGGLPLSAKDTALTLARWFKDQGVELPNRSSEPQGAYRALVEHTEHELGTKHPDRPWAIARIIAEYVEEGTGEKFNDSAESHLRRLVKNSGALPAFDAMGQGVIWGAGINPEYADDPLSLTKYATKILTKDSA